MPNVCNSLLNIYGSESCIDSVLLDLVNNKNELSFDVSLPTPRTLLNVSEHKMDEETKKYHIQKFGYCDWYHWRINNWGTKWDAFNTSIERVGTNHVKIVFDTAWCIPMPWLEFISFKHHELLFEIIYILEMSKRGILTIQDGRIRNTSTAYFQEEYEDLDESFEIEGTNNNL